MIDDDGWASRMLDGEQLQWSGRPRQGIVVSLAGLLVIPFAVVWGAFVFFSEGEFLTTGKVSFQAIWGVGAALVGAYAVVVRPLVDVWIRSRTRYAVTNRRALIVRGNRTTAIDLTKVEGVNLRGGANGGRGTIYFGSSPAWGQWSTPINFGYRNYQNWATDDYRFIGIEDAQQVFNRIENIRSKAA